MEDKTVEITTTEQNKEKRMKRTEDSLRDLWDNIKHINIQIIEVPGEEEKKKGTEKIFEEIIVENFLNRGKEIIKSRKCRESHTMMNNTINEIKNTPEGINSRITEAEEQISELEDKMVEITAREQNKEKRMKRIEDSLRDLWENIKHTNIRIIGVPEEEEKKKGSEKIFEEIIVKNFPNMGKEIIKSRKHRGCIQDKPKEKHAKTHINQTVKT